MRCTRLCSLKPGVTMMLLGETSELSLEPAIEGRFDRSKYVFPSGVAKKYVDAFLERQTPNKNHGGALWSGADGPRPGAGWSATWRRARVLCLTAGRSVRTQRRRPGSRSREGPRQGREILGYI
jgi:hypothetical protein